MKWRFIKQAVLYGLLFFMLLQCFDGVIFLLSHLPPNLVHLDRLLLMLGRIARVFTWPRRILRELWPGETTPAVLTLALTVLNWLIWGMLAVLLKALREKAKA